MLAAKMFVGCSYELQKKARAVVGRAGKSDTTTRSPLTEKEHCDFGLSTYEGRIPHLTFLPT